MVVLLLLLCVVGGVVVDVAVGCVGAVVAVGVVVVMIAVVVVVVVVCACSGESGSLEDIPCLTLPSDFRERVGRDLDLIDIISQ